MAEHPHPDHPLDPADPFHDEVRLLLAPRVDPASNPGPPSNPAVDQGAFRRAAALLKRVIG